MKIVIIGSSGLVGKHLCQELTKQNIPYLGVDLQADDQNTLQKDITDLNALADLPIDGNDVVVHLAARQYANQPPRRQRQAYFDEVNVTGFEHILKTMLAKNCKQLVYFSSDMVYGLPKDIPILENNQHNPIAEYGRSKQKAEQLCDQYRSKGMNITIFRPRLIIGPGRLGVLSKLFRLIEKGLPVPLIGQGDNYYQMISVFDCVSAIIKAIDAQCPNQAYNLGSTNLVNIKTLISELVQTAQSKSKVIKTNARCVRAALKSLACFGIEPMFPEQYQLADKLYRVSIEKAIKELNWHPQHNDQTMLKEAYHCYKNNMR